MSLYGYGPSPSSVGFSGWGSTAIPAAPGATTFSLAGGTYGAGSAVPDNYAGGFNPSNLLQGFGNLVNSGLDIWDRLNSDDDPTPTVAATQPALASSMNPMMLLMIGGALLLAFVLMRK